MCGIVGYIGKKNAVPFLLDGLEKLEYRGYDSSGIAININNSINVIKKQGYLKKIIVLILELVIHVGRHMVILRMKTRIRTFLCVVNLQLYITA